MNNTFQAGTRVFYWNSPGQAVYGTVQQIQHVAGGTLVLLIRTDSGVTVSLPATTVTRVT
ncbi:hypothetical protein DFH09DRAFT_1299733 [Mycena vulgaris]|nr:hypothetical protein DFH09DRAFT_1299733 [Mycena vulgaris]